MPSPSEECGCDATVFSINNQDADSSAVRAGGRGRQEDGGQAKKGAEMRERKGTAEKRTEEGEGEGGWPR